MASQEPTPAHLKRGILITLFAYLCFAVASSLIASFGKKLATIQIFFIQSLISLVCIAPLALRSGLSALKTKHLPLHLLRDLFGAGSTLLFFLALRHLNLVDATILSYTSPFFVPFVWRIWRSEEIPRSVWWSVLIGFTGVAIILNPSKAIFQLGFVYGLFAGMTSAVALCSVRVLNLKQEPMSRTIFYFFLLSALLSGPFAWTLWTPLKSTEWLFCLAIGTAMAAGQIFLTIAYRYGTASYLSPLAYSIALYNAIIAYFAYNQSLGWRSLAGAAFVIIGGTTTYILRKKPATVLETFENPQSNKKPPI